MKQNQKIEVGVRTRNQVKKKKTESSNQQDSSDNDKLLSKK
jgi:hypothetical protein